MITEQTLKNKTSLVTGSTSGIGLAIAEELARQGSHVILNGFGEAGPIESLRSKLEEKYNVKVVYHPADMSKAPEISSLMEMADKELSGVDILINNAGIQYVSPVDDFPPEKWDAILAINLSSAFHTIRLALPGMRKKNWGRIVNIASAHGLVASANKSAYVAAKHGILGLTKTVALETATTGITCNAICPGWVLTPLVEKQIADLANREKISHAQAKEKLLREKQPSLEFVKSEHIAQTVLFLCGEAAGQIRGGTINMDGGWLAQ